MTGLGKGVAGGWVAGRMKALALALSVAQMRASRNPSPEPGPAASGSLYLLPLPGLHSSQPFLLVRLSEHCPKRNYTVFGDAITSEQAVFFTLGHSAASPFYLFFDFTLYLL